MIRSLAVATAMLGVLMILGGCNHSPDSPEEGVDDDANSDESSCAIDSDCETYFRCIDSQCAVPPAMSGERDEDTPQVVFHDHDGELLGEFFLELAVTPEQQSRGLMYRTEMLDDWGMLFPYSSDQHLSFWMKNTLISLDMIFIDNTGVVVGVVAEAEPETLSPRSVGEPARYVLEINGGLAAEQGIDQGAKMSLKNVNEAHQPHR